MKKFISRFSKLESIAFVGGFALMAFELVAARILAPTIGSSTYVWTSVIGVIIAALSFGYWVGGALADRRHEPADIIRLCLLAASSVVLMMVFYEPCLDWIAQHISDSRLQALAASLLLFAPVSLVLGMLSPYLVKLKVTSLDTSGQSVASLSVLNSIGGITGTFVTGFILFGYIGSREALLVVLVLLLCASWVIQPKLQPLYRLVASGIIISTALLTLQTPAGDRISIETPTSHYDIVQSTSYDGRQVRTLLAGPRASQSAVYTDGAPELVFWYTKEIARVIEHQQSKSVLVLGGGTFTLPQYLARQMPSIQVDVVEIDPELESIAREHFFYKSQSNVRLIFNDARAYLRQASTTYDAIVIDAYGHLNIPFQLMSAQYGKELARLLKPEGKVIANVIASQQGNCRVFLDAINGSYKPFLPAAQYSTRSIGDTAGNHIIVYSVTTQPIPGMQSLDTTSAVSYNDNYVPAERLQQSCIEASS